MIGRSAAGSSAGVRSRASLPPGRSLPTCKPTCKRLMIGIERLDMPQRPLRALIIVLALLIFFAGPSLIGFYTNWLWFSEVGYQQVFMTIIRAQATLFTIVFAVAALWLSFNLRLALGAVGHVRPVFTTREGIEVTLPSQ